MTASVRAVTLTGFAEVARHVGINPTALLRQFRISEASLRDPEIRIPAGQVVDLLEEASRQSACPHFGLLMAECRTFQSLGPLCLLLEHLSNIREVIETINQYRRHLNDILVLGLEGSDDSDVLRIELAAEYAAPQACILTIAMAHVVLTGASGGGWRPHAVHFTQPAPQITAPFERFFPVRVQFGSHFNGFSCSKQSMTEPLPRANQMMALHARRLLDSVKLHPEHCPVSDSVSRSVVLLLSAGGATLSNVAANLAMSERTLQRELAREGVSFVFLLNSARRELVLSYLSNKMQSLTAIAGLLGYASSSSFARWFSDEFGLSPSAWRSSKESFSRRVTVGGVKAKTGIARHPHRIQLEARGPESVRGSTRRHAPPTNA